MSHIASQVYVPSVAVLGSRDQLCPNPALSDCAGKEKQKRCQCMVENDDCKYYKKFVEKKNLIVELPAKSKRGYYDIEDWMKEGTQEKFCPFFASRSTLSDAQLIVVPYEVALDPKSFLLLEPYIKDSIIIVEDADLFESHILQVLSSYPEQKYSHHT